MGQGLDMAMVLLVIAVILVLIWIALGYGAGGGTWRVHQLRVTSPDNQLILGSNTGIINNETTSGTVTYNLPDPQIARCNFILSESSSGTQDIHSALQLYGNLVLANDSARSILHGTKASQTGTHNLTIHGSDSAGSATGGSITLQAGESATGTGGDINLIPGKGGQVNIDGSSPIVLSGDMLFTTTADHSIKFTATGTTKHDLLIQGLNTSGAAQGGYLTLAAGTNTGAAEGGHLNLLGGNGGTTSGGGGSVDLVAGDGVTDGTGGTVNITSGNGTGAGHTGGGVLLTTGDATADAAGFMQLLGGTSTGGAGGQINITAGQGSTVGGSLNLVSGKGQGTGIKSGGLNLDVGSSTDSLFGDIKIGTARAADLYLGTGSSNTKIDSTSIELTGKLTVDSDALIKGALQTTPNANLVITGNAGPTLSLLSTVSSNLRLSASDASSANFIESGDSSKAGAKRELRFSGIAGTPLWWTMNANGSGNLDGQDATDASSSTDASAAFHTKGGVAIEKKLYVGTSLFLPSGGSGTALDWYEEANFNSGYTFIPGGATVAATDVKVTRIGRQVTLNGPTLVAKGTNNGVLTSNSGLSAKFRPSANYQQPVIVYLNGAVQTAPGLLLVDSGTGVVGIFLALNAGLFTAQAGDNGIVGNWSATYFVS
jgi:hypothetical protein